MPVSRFRRGVSSPRIAWRSPPSRWSPSLATSRSCACPAAGRARPRAAGAAPVLHIDDGMRTHRFTAVAGRRRPARALGPARHLARQLRGPVGAAGDPRGELLARGRRARVTRLPRPVGGEGGRGGGRRRPTGRSLAERRARRAELAEEAQTRRAAEARAEAAAARSELETLQRDLDSLSPRPRRRRAPARRVRARPARRAPGGASRPTRPGWSPSRRPRSAARARARARRPARGAARHLRPGARARARPRAPRAGALRRRSARPRGRARRRDADADELRRARCEAAEARADAPRPARSRTGASSCAR